MMALVARPIQPIGHIRLSVIYLLVWTCGVAAGIRSYQALTPELQEWVRPLEQVYTIVMGCASGTFVAGAGMIAYHRYRCQRQYPCLAGHWLLLFGFTIVLAISVAIGVYVMIPLERAKPSIYWSQFLVRWDANSFSLLHQTIGWGLGSFSALSFLWYLRRCVSNCWVLVFFLFFVASACLFGGYLVTLLRHIGLDSSDGSLWAWYLAWCRRSGEIYAALYVTCAVGMLCAIIQDVRRGAPTDWLHWAGIATWLTVAAMQIVTFAVITFGK